MPKNTQSAGTELESYLDKLLNKGAKSGSVTEDEIQVVTDAQLTSIYRALRDQGVEVVSQGEDEDAPLDVDDDGLDDDLDDESIEDHDIKVAKLADSEMGSVRKKRSRARTSRSRSRVRGIDASTVIPCACTLRKSVKSTF